MPSFELSRSLLAACALCLAPCPAAALQTHDDHRPNIVVLLADDLGWRDTGPYGNPAVHTPNIDRLARDGLLVRYAFGTSPQCSPSRISMLSGRWPHATRTEDLHTPLPPGIPILPALLRRVGYFTGDMAKTHYGPSGERQFEWYSPETASALPAFLDAAGARPFFLWVGFHEPHRPYPEGRPSHAPARVRLTPYLADAPGTREDLARYYDAIERMDTKIGMMMAELERRRLLEHTVIVFLSDNGAPFPREKGALYDGGTRTPLILDWPGVVRAGSVWDRGMVSTLDLAPTLLEVAGATPPPDMQGGSFRALLDAPATFAGDSVVFSERNWHDCDEHQRAVRTTRFKLIRTDAYADLPLCTPADLGASPAFHDLRARLRTGHLRAAQRRLFESPRARLELYDLQRDPWEVTNVADDPAYAPTARALAQVLEGWIEGTDDFPATYRMRDDNTDRITGVQFTTKIPPLRNPEPPPPAERWGVQGPS
jgi:arylsulfatase A-like enzyme